MPRVVRGKTRSHTFDLFSRAVRDPQPGELPLLLVDSEGPVTPGRSVWQHLKARDGWTRPHGSSDDQAFLMVQVTETWFLADQNLLRTYFGHRFRGRHLKKWPSLEDVPKSTVLNVLDQATRDCPKPYSKGKICFEILGKINPSLVEESCPNAKRLLDRLRAVPVTQR